MAIIASVGSAHGNNPIEVGKDAYQKAAVKLEGKTPSIAFVFSSIFYDQHLMLEGMKSIAGTVPIVGCSTAGEIVTEGPLEHESVSVMLIASDGEISFSCGLGTNVKGGERAAGKMAAESVAQIAGGKDKLHGFIMLPDGLAGNGAEIVRGVLDVLGEHFPVIGGSAGDDFRMKETYQYMNGEVRSGDVVGIGLTGAFSYGIGVKHGWGALGRKEKVTRASGNVIHEIEGKPAIEIYEKYFGDHAKSLRNETLSTLAVSYPLGLHVEGSEEYLIRDPLSVNAEGSITCAAEVPEGGLVRIMMGTRESAIAMASKAAEDAKAQLEGKTPKAIFIFNCIARKKLFGARGGEEIEAIKNVLGRDVPLIGFYTYGEQAPINGEVKNIEQCNTVFHNETVVIYVIAE